MAQPFVKIIDNKLTLVGKVPQGNPRVVSILGKARMGKSTLFNAVVTHLSRQSQAPFKAIYGEDHCTRGIDSFFLPEHNLLLLDSQGLDYEDASHDPHLLLLLYIISDVIIFNDTRRLENGALKLMEPVCTFTNYLDIESVVKPKLYFRIIDSDVKDTQKNLEKVLGTYQDQYQSIRNSIKHLFDGDIRLLKTEPLDKPARIMLENNMYRELLAEPLGFREAVETILTAANTMTSKSALSQTPDIIEQINSNKEISIEKLDVVKLQAENDIHKWIQTMVPDAVYTSIEVDGTQKCFDDVVEPRKNAKKGLLSAFTKRFRDVEENLRGPFYKSISEKMDAPIQKAIEDSRYKARNKFHILQERVQADREFPSVNSMKNSFTTIPDQYWKDYLRSFYELEEKIQILYEPIKKEIENWLQEVYNVVYGTIGKIKAEEKAQAGAVEKLLDEETLNLEAYLLEKMKGCINSKTVINTNTQILMSLYKEKRDEIVATIADLTPRHTVKFRMEKQRMIPTVRTTVEDKNPQEYDLVTPLFNHFVTSIVDNYIGCDNSAITKELTDQKKNFLYNKHFPAWLAVKVDYDSTKSYVDHPWTAKLIKSNPEIRFVQDQIAGNVLLENKNRNIMSSDTNIDIYISLYEEVLKILVDKGYCNEDCAKNKIMVLADTEQGKETLLRFVKAENKYEQILQSLFTKRLKKEYCKKVVKNTYLPNEINLEDLNVPNAVTIRTIFDDDQ